MKVRTRAQLICSRISGRCVLIGSLFSLAVWRVSAEGQVSLRSCGSCRVAWLLALRLHETPLLCPPLSLFSTKQGKLKEAQTRPRAQGPGDFDVKVEAQGLIMVLRTESGFL